MDLYNLGLVSWWESQCYYHALAYLGREGIIICRPSNPYVCLGIHDDLDQEIDRDFCQENGLPLLRRETAGGVVYLDSRQVFYQVILHKNNPYLPLKRIHFFPRILQPAIDLYRSFGIDALLVPPADIKAGGRKCSGNAAGDIGPSVVYVGNIIMDFDFEAMSKVLKVPTPTYRRHLLKAMQDHMLTLAGRMNGTDVQVLELELVKGFERQFGNLNCRSLDNEIKQQSVLLKERLTSKEWLNQPGRQSKLRRIKIAEGVYLREVRSDENKFALALVQDGRVEGITIP
jgi:lipoate-protein ligase A